MHDAIISGRVFWCAIYFQIVWPFQKRAKMLATDFILLSISTNSLIISIKIFEKKELEYCFSQCFLLEKAMATHSSTLAWKIPWTAEPGRLQSMGSLRVWHDRATSLSCVGGGNGNPLQCSCLESPRDGGAWWAAVYGVAQSQTRLKWLSSSSSSSNVSSYSSCPKFWGVLCICCHDC